MLAARPGFTICKLVLNQLRARRRAQAVVPSVSGGDRRAQLESTAAGRGFGTAATSMTSLHEL